ncbi:MAG TPA: CHASE2 domain-containing protein, partial [Geobacteraceae bacterium]|nr:CHASE2 domain-containing protein [Geobacteraceae bacterium]
MKKVANIYLITALTVFLVLFLYHRQTDLLERFEEKTYDVRVKALHAPPGDRSSIAIIAIDDRTIHELGRFPFSREHYAALLDVTRQAGAKAVLFDAFFPEEQSRSVDEAFAAAIRRSGNVTLACGMEFAPDGTVSAITSSIPILEKAARRIAQINVLPDSDGVIRWTRLAIPHGGRFYPSLGLSGAAELMGAEGFDVGFRYLKIGNRKIPTDSGQRMLINYSGPPGSYARYSFVDVLKGKIGEEKLKGKVLYVGATALGIYDMRITPFSNNS